MPCREFIGLSNLRQTCRDLLGEIFFSPVDRVDRAKVYIDQTAWFAELRKEFPDVELGVCDCWSFNLERRLPTVEILKERYPGINFVSMHAHNPRQLWASPKEMYETFDPYLDSGIKIHLTEFGIILGDITGTYRSGPWTEDLLAEYFVQALATAFSHESVRTFNLWSNYEKFTGNPLFTEEGEPNVKYEATQCLLQDYLTTRVSGRTDDSIGTQVHKRSSARPGDGSGQGDDRPKELSIGSGCMSQERSLCGDRLTRLSALADRFIAHFSPTLQPSVHRVAPFPRCRTGPPGGAGPKFR